MPLVLVLTMILRLEAGPQSEASTGAVHAALPAQTVEAGLGGKHQWDVRCQQRVFPHVLQPRLVLRPHIEKDPGLTS